MSDTTRYTFVVEYPGNGPRVGLKTPMPHGGKLIAVSFEDALKESDRYLGILTDIATGRFSATEAEDMALAALTPSTEDS